MEKFTKISSKVIPLPLKNVDTDMIIPADYLTSTSRDGYGENVFRRLREAEADFPFNLKKFAGAQILAAEVNFGCGSSREHAVWALLGAGIRVIVAVSFADIFSSNAAKNGLVLVQLPEQVVRRILKLASEGDLEMEVDLPHQLVRFAGEEQAFPFDPFRKNCIVNGLDDLGYLRARMEEIGKFKEKRRERLFYKTV